MIIDKRPKERLFLQLWSLERARYCRRPKQYVLRMTTTTGIVRADKFMTTVNLYAAYEFEVSELCTQTSRRELSVYWGLILTTIMVFFQLKCV